MPPREKSPGRPTHWGDAADWYDKLVGDAGSEYHRQVVLPGAMRLLAPQPGESILDIACGQGVLCRLLDAAVGETSKITGIDAARELIRAARRHGPPRIDYQVGDARNLDHFPSNHFDAAACILAIQNIHPIQSVFAGVSRLLKPQCRFVLVIMHPCFRGPKETSWGWDPGLNIQYRRVDRYLIPRKTPIATHPGSAPREYTWSFHKPLESYVKALSNAGLLIDALEEWPSHKSSQPGPRAAAENQARKEIPLFLAIRARKLPPIDAAADLR